MTQPLRVGMIGFGKVAAGNAHDPVMAKTYSTASHVQAVSAHPDLELVAVADPDPAARKAAQSNWNIAQVFASAAEMGAAGDIDIAVLANPPGTRVEDLRTMKNLRGVVIEKPLGLSRLETDELVTYCQAGNVTAQVHFWRRAVRAFRTLHERGLTELVGQTQHAHVVYGNGLLNNGLHHVDFVRFTLGEIASVRALPETMFTSGPLCNDFDVSFTMVLDSGLPVFASAIDFAHYRENAIEVWGTKGVLAIRNDGREMVRIPLRPHGGLSDNWEVAYDHSEALDCQFSNALFEIYDNLAQTLRGEAELFAPLADAARSEHVVRTIFESARSGGTEIRLEPRASI